MLCFVASFKGLEIVFTPRGANQHFWGVESMVKTKQTKKFVL